MDFALSLESYFSNQFPSFCKTDLRETSAIQEIRTTLCMVAVGHTKRLQNFLPLEFRNRENFVQWSLKREFSMTGYCIIILVL